MIKVAQNESLTRLLYQPWIVVLELIKYILFGTGLLGVPIMIASMFIQTALVDDNLDIIRDTSDIESTWSKIVPDVEIMPFASQGIVEPIRGCGVFTLHTALVQPKSHGTVRLASGDPLDRPIVNLNFFSDSRDFIVARKGVRFSMNLAETMMKQGYPCEPLMWPKSKSDEDIDAFTRSMARSCFHYSCTCRMAAESDTSPGVVDDELKVHGITNLRVCDTSVFPQIVSAHTMAPVVGVAEICAEMIKRSAGDL
jgi:hypothetical protein